MFKYYNGSNEPITANAIVSELSGVVSVQHYSHLNFQFMS